MTKVLRALPINCVDLELSLVLGEPDRTPDGTHFCDEVRALLPRMRRVRVDFEPICGSLLGKHTPGEGFRVIPLP